MARRQIDAEHVVGRLTSRREDTTTETSLVERALILIILRDVVLEWLEVDHRHAIIKLVLNTNKQNHVKIQLIDS